MSKTKLETVVENKFKDIDFSKRELTNFYGDDFDARRKETLTPAKVRNDAAVKISLIRSELHKIKSKDKKLFKQVKSKENVNNKYNVKGNQYSFTLLKSEQKQVNNLFNKNKDALTSAKTIRHELSKELFDNNRLYRRQKRSINQVDETAEQKQLYLDNMYSDYLAVFNDLTKSINQITNFVEGKLKETEFLKTKIGIRVQKRVKRYLVKHEALIKNGESEVETTKNDVERNKIILVNKHKKLLDDQKVDNQTKVIRYLEQIDFIKKQRDEKIAELKLNTDSKKIKIENDYFVRTLKTLKYDSIYFFKQFATTVAEKSLRLTLKHDKNIVGKSLKNKGDLHAQLASISPDGGWDKEFHTKVAKKFEEAYKEYVEFENKNYKTKDGLLEFSRKDSTIDNAKAFNENIKSIKSKKDAFKDDGNKIEKIEFDFQNSKKQYLLIEELIAKNKASLKKDDKVLSSVEIAILKEEIRNNKRFLKAKARREIRLTHLKRREREISVMAKKNDISKLRLDTKRNIELDRLHNKYYKTKFDSKETRQNHWSKLKEIKKDAYNVEEYLSKSTPTEVQRGTRWFLAILNLLYGGLGYFFARQYKKAFVFLIITSILYWVGLPFAFGATHIAGNGISGIGSLGVGHWLSDGRFFLVEGVYGLVILIVTIMYVFIMTLSAYRLGTLMEKGLRPNTWFITKKVLDRVQLPYLLSIPAVAIILFLTIAPLMTLLLIMFTDWGAMARPAFGEQISYVGFDNFKAVFGGGQTQLMQSITHEFWQVVGWTFIWGFSTWSIGTIMRIAIAMLMESERIKFRTFWKTIMILPSAIPAFIMIIMFSLMVRAPSSVGDTNGGPLFNLMVDMHLWDPTLMHGGATTINDPMQNVVFIKTFLILMSFWFGIGGGMMFFGGLLTSIPTSLYEAAEVDGAGVWKAQKAITIPHLLFIVTPVLIPWLVQSLNNFGLIYLFSAGGPIVSKSVTGFGETDIILSLIYKIIEGSKSSFANSYGIGSVIVVVFGLLSVGVALPGVIKSKSLKEGGY